MRGVPVAGAGVPFHALPRTILLLFAAVSIIGVTQTAAVAQSGSAQLSAEYMKCIDAPNRTSYGFTECGKAELKRQTQSLDQAWADVQKKIRDEGTAATKRFSASSKCG
jgi:hypothetical protein